MQKVKYYVKWFLYVLVAILIIAFVCIWQLRLAMLPPPPLPKYQTEFQRGFKSTSLKIDVDNSVIFLWVQDSLKYALKYPNGFKKKELLDSLYKEYIKIYQNENNNDSINIIIYNNFFKKKNEIGRKLDTMIRYPLKNKVDSLRVDFTEKFLPSPQLFGFDARRKGNIYTKWANNFEAIRLKNGRTYFVPYQSLEGATLTATNTQTEQVIANLKYIPKSGLDASKPIFRLKNSTTPLAKIAVNDSTYIVNLPAVPISGTSGNEPCVYAYYEVGSN